jgi:type III secretory pathway component EscU
MSVPRERGKNVLKAVIYIITRFFCFPIYTRRFFYYCALSARSDGSVVASWMYLLKTLWVLHVCAFVVICPISSIV